MERWKNKKGVLTVVLVWGWTGREALGETGVCFCSDDCREKQKEKKKIYFKVKWFDRQKLTVINHSDSCLCVD